MGLSTWHYQRRCDGSGLEQASWIGDSGPALDAHFHVETQVTIVAAGARRFLTRAGLLVARAGETAILPGGLPHRALGLETAGTVSVNLYLPPAATDFAQFGACVATTPRWLVPDAPLDASAVAGWIKSAVSGTSAGTALAEERSTFVAALTDSPTSIGDLAPSFGLTREGFIRRFSRMTGMTPHRYRIVHKLNNARAMLSAGVAPAGVAADAGFADQSHLGRAFRLAFGITPSAYQRVMLR